MVSAYLKLHGQEEAKQGCGAAAAIPKPNHLYASQEQSKEVRERGTLGKRVDDDHPSA